VRWIPRLRCLRGRLLPNTDGHEPQGLLHHARTMGEALQGLQAHPVGPPDQTLVLVGGQHEYIASAGPSEEG